MIETETLWKDSGFDCDHCGGEVSRRIDRETGQPDRICFQCLHCGCQWRPDGRPLRVGRLRQCQQAQKERGSANAPQTEFISSTRVRALLALAFILVLIRLGGFSLLRLLLPLAFLAGVVYLVRLYGKEQEWW